MTLVWHDYPGTPSAAKALVNDLDLTVRAAGLTGVPLLVRSSASSKKNLPPPEQAFSAKVCWRVHRASRPCFGRCLCVTLHPGTQ